MAIEIYSSNDTTRGKLLFSLDFASHQLLSRKIGELKTKTGITIDPYGTTRLYRNHACLLAGLIESAGIMDLGVIAFCEFLKISPYEALILEGD
jgi:hypothetical protein